MLSMNKKAQSTLEFTMVFVITLLFVVLTVNLFVWFNHCMVRRQVEYENSRTSSVSTQVGKSDFFTPPELNAFIPGGYSSGKK